MYTSLKPPPYAAVKPVEQGHRCTPRKVVSKHFCINGTALNLSASGPSRPGASVQVESSSGRRWRIAICVERRALSVNPLWPEPICGAVQTYILDSSAVCRLQPSAVDVLVCHTTHRTACGGSIAGGRPSHAATLGVSLRGPVCDPLAAFPGPHERRRTCPSY
jgi:hypothetical protein